MSELVASRAFDTLRVSGPDRLSWLNGLVTANLVGKKPGDALFALAVQKNGKIESELCVLVRDDDLLVGVHAGTGEAMRARLDKHLIMEDAAIEPADLAWALAFSPDAEAIATRALQAGASAGVTRRAGHAVAILAASDAAKLPGPFATTEAWLRFRVENGIAERGDDYGPENYPQEAALEKDEVSFDKGCYLGQESVFMLEKRGHVSKRLVQLACDAVVARGDKITDDAGKDLGEITSSIGELALGYVRYKHAHAGAVVRVGRAAAKVTEKLAI